MIKALEQMGYPPMRFDYLMQRGVLSRRRRKDLLLLWGHDNAPDGFQDSGKSAASGLARLRLASSIPRAFER